MRILSIFLLYIFLISCQDNAVAVNEKGADKKVIIENFRAKLTLPKDLDFNSGNVSGSSKLVLTWLQDLGRSYKIEEYTFGFTDLLNSYPNQVDGIFTFPVNSNIEEIRSYRIIETSSGATAELDIHPIFYRKIISINGSVLVTTNPVDENKAVIFASDRVLDFNVDVANVINSSISDSTISNHQLNTCAFTLDKPLLLTSGGVIDSDGSSYNDSSNSYIARNNASCLPVPDSVNDIEKDNLAVVMAGSSSNTVNSQIFSIKKIAGVNDYSWNKLDDGVFEPREQASTAYFNNKIWLIGGRDGGQIFQDIWTADIKYVTGTNSNGILLENWQKLKNIPFSARYDFSTKVIDDYLWIFGGKGEDGLPVEDSIWYTKDGENWINIETNIEPFSGSGLVEAGRFNWQIAGSFAGTETGSVYQLKKSITIPATTKIETITAGSTSTIDLTFRNIANAQTYELNYLNSLNDPTSSASNIIVSTSRYTHQTLKQSNPYSYIVRACNENGCSSWSTKFATTYTKIITPSIKLQSRQNLDAITKNDIHLALFCLNNDGEYNDVYVTYQSKIDLNYTTAATIDRRLSDLICSGTNSQQTVSLTDLATSADYTIIYTVTNPVHNASNILELKTFAEPLFDEVVLGTDSITLNWADVYGAKDYNLIRRIRRTTEATIIQVGTGNSYTDTNLAMATEYQYLLQVCNEYTGEKVCLDSTTATNVVSPIVPPPKSVVVDTPIKNGNTYDATIKIEKPDGDIRGSYFYRMISSQVATEDIALDANNQYTEYLITNLIPQYQYSLKFFGVSVDRISASSKDIIINTPNYSETAQLANINTQSFDSNSATITIVDASLSEEQRSLTELSLDYCMITINETGTTVNPIEINKKCSFDSEESIQGLTPETRYNVELKICQAENTNCLQPIKYIN